MDAIDTNVLVRYLTQDDPAQSRRANALVDDVLATRERLHLDVVVLCELVWVLREAYGFDRRAVVTTLSKILEVGQFSVADRDLVHAAVAAYAAAGGDFADYVIGLRNRRAGCRTTLTLDRGLRKNPSFTVL